MAPGGRSPCVKARCAPSLQSRPAAPTGRVSSSQGLAPPDPPASTSLRALRSAALTLAPGSLGEGHPPRGARGLANRRQTCPAPTTPSPPNSPSWPGPTRSLTPWAFPPTTPTASWCGRATLGPSAVLAWRRMAGTLIHRPDGYTLDVADLAQALGARRGHGAPLPGVSDAAAPGGVRPGPLRGREHLRRASPHPPGVVLAATPARPRAAAAPHRPPGPSRH